MSPLFTRSDMSETLLSLEKNRTADDGPTRPYPGREKYVIAAEQYAYLRAHYEWYRRKAELLKDENRRLRDRILELEGFYDYD